MPAFEEMSRLLGVDVYSSRMAPSARCKPNNKQRKHTPSELGQTKSL